jgi:hypothetical protein
MDVRRPVLRQMGEALDRAASARTLPPNAFPSQKRQKPARKSVALRRRKRLAVWKSRVAFLNVLLRLEKKHRAAQNGVALPEH